MTEPTNLNSVVNSVKITKTLSIKPDSDSTEKKTITLVIDFDGTMLGSVFESAVRSDVIKWQGNNRDKFDLLEDGQIVNRKFAAPPVAVVTPEMAEAAVVSKLASMTSEEDRLAFIEEMIAKATK